MTTPDDAAVIADQTDQKDARLITLTTCKYSLDEQDSLSARLIVRGRFKYWANTADGIPKELAPKQSTPIQQAKATIARSIQKASKYAPVSQLLFTATLTIWCILTGLSWLIWHKDRQKKTTSWNLMTLIWPSLMPLGWGCLVRVSLGECAPGVRLVFPPRAFRVSGALPAT